MIYQMLKRVGYPFLFSTHNQCRNKSLAAAAAKFDLDFIPVTEDTYLWAYQTFSEQDPEVIAFIEMLKSSEFQDEVNQLAGYACDDCGELAPLNAFMSE